MKGKEGREREKGRRREINYLKQRLGEIEKRESEQLSREREKEKLEQNVREKIMLKKKIMEELKY